MDPSRLRRIRFRAWRRGFREADLILGRFADAWAERLSETDLARFETLLDQPDHDIFAWVMGSAPIPPAFDDELMARLRAFDPSSSTVPAGL
jgi:antitoxin CptB